MHMLASPFILFCASSQSDQTCLGSKMEMLGVSTASTTSCRCLLDGQSLSAAGPGKTPPPRGASPSTLSFKLKHALQLAPAWSSPSDRRKSIGQSIDISASVARFPENHKDVRKEAPVDVLASLAAAAGHAPRGFSAAAEGKVVAVVGRGKQSPWGDASWKEVLEQMGRKLTRSDGEMEMRVVEDAHLMLLDTDADHHATRLFRDADLVVVVNVDGASAAGRIAREAAHVGTLVAFDSHPDLRSRLGGVQVGHHPTSSSSLLRTVRSALRLDEADRQLRMVQEVWHRVSSDNVLVALQLLIHNYVTPVRSLQKLQAQGVGFLTCAVANCGPQILACLMDPEARAALQCMQECDPTDQLCTYRCIAGHESPKLHALSLCLLEKHNCLGLCAAVPMHLAAAPMRTFRGAPLTHQVAEDLLVGWCRQVGHSWKIAGNMFPIASQFRSQTQTFYREGEGGGRMWYDPVFKVTAEDGREVWRRRHYSVDRGEQPGTFSFSFLDNGVMTREFWIIVHVAHDLSWALFHSVGAAQRTGQTFTGAVVCTPTGAWPADCHRERLNRALESCDIKEWETVRVDHSSYVGAPRLGPPEHVRATQVFLGESSTSSSLVP